MKSWVNGFYGFLLLVIIACDPENDYEASKGDYIQPFKQNPAYWQYEEKPVLLLGGSPNDNLFQNDNLKSILDSVKAVGGNYLRNTMSSRDSGDVWPFKKLDNGKYNLAKFNSEYWSKFEKFIRLAHEQDIIIQVEIWDPFDYSREPWKENPFNPKNNINYSINESGLDTVYPAHPAADKQPFFHSIPGMGRYSSKLDKIRNFQKARVKKLLSISLNYNNILYCMNNETGTPLKWGKYWIDFAQKEAGKKEKDIYTTDMVDHFFVPASCARCQRIIKDTALYRFLDISQNNSRNMDQAHWDTLQYIIEKRNMFPARPVNNTKIYGGDTTSWGSGTNKDGVERFCRNIIGGCASARHHRPPKGNGLNKYAKASIYCL